ncbi:MAG: two-component system sensor histidine kinase AtoS [Holophaga sp.]|nr:two-component system sensor histidine kinase AtoS [Holophaga sp.]
MLTFLRPIWPSTLRMQLMLALLPVVGLPIVATGYVLKLRGLQAVVEEKRVHLQGVDALLNQHLQNLGGYRRLLADYPGPASDRNGQIRYLNTRLRGYTDQVAQAFPGVGVGFFNLGLDAIITYGPSGQYEKTVGISIPRDHPGWKVMASGTAMTVSGALVRGNIMNAMLPIKEEGRVVGYIWANELLDAIDQQANAMSRAVRSMTILGLAFSLAVVFFVIAQLTANMKKIKRGLVRLGFDLKETIPPIRGEIGEIAEAINKLAQVLLETQSMHHNILDSLSDTVVTMDAKNTISYINPAGCELFRCQAREILGKPYLQLFPDDPTFSSLLLDTLKSGREYRGVEFDFTLPHQTPHILASSSQLFDGRGHSQGVVAIIRDISETRSLRQQVARADRLAAVGEVSAGIAHELRTPLTSIRGFVQFLQGSTDPQEWREYGDIIIREVDGMNRIISELLSLVRPQPLNLVATDLNQLVEDTLFLARDSGSKGRIAFVIELSVFMKPVKVDPGQIKQVLLNILVNATQAIAERGRIQISTARHGEHEVSICVTDNGCGIPEAVREHIFDPFFSTKPNGTGLGMAIARRIIEDHHGRIEVASTEGEGSSITLILPCLAEEGTHES